MANKSDTTLHHHLSDIKDGKAPWFCVETVERDSNEISGREYVQNPYWNAETKRGFLVGKWLLGFKPDQVLVAREREGTASALLKEAGIEVLLVEDSNVGKKVDGEHYEKSC